jgi:hypothetical protein
VLPAVAAVRLAKRARSDERILLDVRVALAIEARLLFAVVKRVRVLIALPARQRPGRPFAAGQNHHQEQQRDTAHGTASGTGNFPSVTHYRLTIPELIGPPATSPSIEKIVTRHRPYNRHHFTGFSSWPRWIAGEAPTNTFYIKPAISYD